MKTNNKLSKTEKEPEKSYRLGTVVIDAEVLNSYKKLAEEKGVYHNQLISETLKDYIANYKQNQNI